MTIHKIVSEIEARIDTLREKEKVYERKINIIYLDMTDEEYWSLPKNDPKKINLKELENKLSTVRNEKSVLKDMLYAYNKYSYKI